MSILRLKPLTVKIWKLKVEEPLKRGFVKVQAIRVYPSQLKEFSKEIDSTVERGEQPVLMVKRTVRKKTGAPEVEIVFLGQYHIEELAYFVKDPGKWKSWGLIVLSPEQAKRFLKVLGEMTGEVEEL